MMQQRADNRIDTRHVDVLDGVRAFAVLIVCWYHIWQQSWLMPILRTPWLSKIGISSISLDVIPRTGYIFVDCMLLLSAFCLFLPHARAMVEGSPVPDALTFYKKRISRIVPSYYLAVLLIFFGFAVPSGAFSTAGDAITELIANLTFMQMFLPGPYLYSKINGVLWTVCVEMQFYLLFPLLAACFRKKPLWTYVVMLSISFLYIRVYALPRPGSVRMTVNQLPSFFGVFANGMLAAYVFVFLANRLRRTKRLAVAATALFFLSVLGVSSVLHGAAAAQSVPVYQLEARFLFSLTLTALILSAAFSARWLRFLFSNRPVRLFSGISFNLYIWHQWLAVRLKDWRIPYWAGETYPNFTGNKPWQWQYTLLCFAAAILLAALVTYLYERPVTDLLLRQRWGFRPIADAADAEGE